MSIDEKAKEYESNIGSQDYVPTEIEEAFKAGANWMLDKTIDWMHDKGFFDTVEYTINIEKFIRAMEE